MHPSKSENLVSWIVKIVFYKIFGQEIFFFLLIALHSTQDKDNTLYDINTMSKQETNDIPGIHALGWFTVYFLNLPVIRQKNL